MARLTSEVAALKIGNRYDLVLIATRRARELSYGWQPMVKCANGRIVTALREIEAGAVGVDYRLKQPNIDRREKPQT